MIKRLILDEASRRDLIDKGKRGDQYVPSNRFKGRNRYERRKHSRIYTNVAQYNNLDMNLFFKHDILLVGIKVIGETDEYITKIKFKGILEEVAKEVKKNNNKLEFKTILTSLIRIFNTEDVFVNCSCEDWKYRQAYWATQKNYNSGPMETRVSDITNPSDSKGSGCKHVMLVLANMDWILKVTSVINNYIKYAKQSMQRLYADYIFPKIYGMRYDRAVQLDIFDTDDFDSSPLTLDDINKIGRKSGQFTPGNPYRFQKKEKPEPEEKLPLDFPDDENTEESEKV